jgi:exo-beta-1,3-glucanase (GH17 family)/cellulose synthase/poly-beta-1,6-N-acetylglucosamine synthase-like glycosyltransferase
MRAAAFVVVLAACLHAAVWGYFQPSTQAPDIQGPIASISYAPFEGEKQAGDVTPRPTAEQIRKDLAALAPYTNAIRTYSATNGMELVPGIAAEFGLKVTLGIWIDKDEARNEREIRSGIELAKRHSNVKAIFVGNEAVLRGDKTVDQMIALIKRVKKQVNVPVSTGETWDVWEEVAQSKADPNYRKEYRLASAVDFVGAHILPYWEGGPASAAVDSIINRYNDLRHILTGKRIEISEFGWPSAGYNRQAAEPGRTEQALVIRNFISRARALGIDYNVIEAFDQPWKTFEGSVGSYWGLFDTTRTPKFAWTGPITNPVYTKLAGIAVAVGLLISLPLLAMAGATFGQLLMLALASHVVGFWAATVFDFWNSHYFVFGAAIAFFIATLLLIPLVVIAMARIQEIATVLFGRAPRRLLPTGLAATAAGYAPKVSIHIPAYRENPEMLKATLDAVARLDYDNYECILVINNTPDPAMWRPVEEHCKLLGERFKFLNIDNLQGFKAGALRLALACTAQDAEIIGIIDADYAVSPDWLKDLTPVFADPKVGLVQAPQDHRDGSRSLMHQAMNAEYAGFFDIGMVQRNETNAIIVHGTMCLVRRAAMEQCGGWSSDTICEDTDLGLSIIEHGWLTHYTNRRYGHGLLPDTFDAYKKQRHRWAYGGVQIARKHWRRMLPGASRLASDQRREFSMGWLNWLGAESIGVIVAILNLLWVPVVAFVGIAIPDKILTLPILAAFVVSVMHFVTLYRARVRISPAQMASAMLAAMSMQWTVARAVGFGLIRDHLPFVVTAKGGVARKRQTFPAANEAIMGGLLILGAVIVYMTNYERVREINLFAAVLVVQSIPFLAAVALAAIEESRFNQFAYWQNLGAQIAHPLGLAAPPVAPQPVRAEVIEPREAALQPSQFQATSYQSTAFDPGPSGQSTIIS